MLDELGFRVTISCDNRLMSRTTLTREFALLAEALGYTVGDVRPFTINAANAVFVTDAERRSLVDRIETGYDDLG